MRFVYTLAGISLLTAIGFAQTAAPNPLKPYIKEDAPVIVLNNVRLIDGTGAPAQERMRIDIDHGRIVNVQSAMLRNAFPPGAKVIAETGPAWPRSTLTSLPVSASQIRPVPSQLTVASQVPSGAIATASAEPSWPVRMLLGRADRSGGTFFHSGMTAR